MFDNDLGNYVDILSYTDSNPYITPSDGYVWVYTTPAVKGYMILKGANSGNQFYFGSEAVSGCWGMFVKKGMKLYQFTGYVPYMAYFYPLQ